VTRVTNPRYADSYASNFSGHTGRAWRETDEADTDRATLIQHLFEGQYTNLVSLKVSIVLWKVITFRHHKPSMIGVSAT